MRLVAAAILAGATVAVPAFGAPPPVGAGDGTIPTGNWATATGTASSVSLRLHFEMQCGQPGPGPLVVKLPAAFRIGALRVLVRGAVDPATASGSTVTVQLPKPTGVTCMSIVEGVLPVTLTGVHTAPGTYTVQAAIRNRTFTARLRIVV